MVTDNTTVARYVTVILIGGADVEAFVNYYGAVANSPQISDVGFTPTVVLSCGTGNSASSGAPGTYMIWNMGAAIWRPSVKQQSMHLFSRPDITTTATTTLIDNSKFTGEFTSVYGWSAYVDQFTSTGMYYTYTGSPSTDAFGLLFLKIPGINVDIHSIQIPSSTGEVSITNPGFKPGLLIGCMGNSSTISSGADHMAGSFGASNGATEGVVSCYSVTGVGTSDAGGKFNTALFAHPSPSGHAYSIGQVSSLDPSGYTVNWTSVYAPAINNYGYVIAFQDPDDNKKIIGNTSGKLFFKQ